MKYLIIGNGFLGNAYADHFEGYLFTEKVVSQQMMHDIVSAYRPEYVINCAGKTGRPNIDWCETHKEETFYANVTLPTYINKSCDIFGAKMIHIGSGCTYQGDNNGSGFSETDVPNWDGNYYAWTKIVSERYLAGFDVLQLRIRMPLSGDKNPRNLLSKLMGYNRIVESDNSITYVDDLLKATEALIAKNVTGIFNVVNAGSLKHTQLLHHYEKISGNKLNFEVIDTQQLDTITAARRSNCVLSTAKLESIGIYMPSAIDAMERCMLKYCGIVE
jgi:dTDP-4-dehydrorhamnose reductase